MKNLPSTNTLAYFAEALMTKKKKFYDFDTRRPNSNGGPSNGARLEKLDHFSDMK